MGTRLAAGWREGHAGEPSLACRQAGHRGNQCRLGVAVWGTGAVHALRTAAQFLPPSPLCREPHCPLPTSPSLRRRVSAIDSGKPMVDAAFGEVGG